MSGRWQRQYGTEENEDVEDDFQVIYQRGFIAQYDPSTFSFKKPISAVRCWFITAALIISVVVVTIVSISLAAPDETQSITKESDFSFLQSAVQSDASLLTCSLDSIRLIASNEYGVYSGPYPYLTENGGMQLVEPYKTTELLLNGAETCMGGTSILQWQIYDSQSKLVFSSKSTKPSTAIKLVRTGNYAITVKLSARAVKAQTFYTGKITCK